MQIAEIEIRYKSKVPASEREVIRTSMDCYNIFKELFPDIEHRERMVLLLLNRRNAVLGHYLVSIGGTSGTVCDPKIVFQVCLKANASYLVLAHNHPSGNLTPSKADIDLTKKIKEGAKLLELQLMDHLIITAESYYSFADEGVL